MSNAGFSSYKIQDVTGIQARTVQKFLKRVRERGSVENLPRSGRKKEKRHFAMTGASCGASKRTGHRL